MRNVYWQWTILLANLRLILDRIIIDDNDFILALDLFLGGIIIDDNDFILILDLRWLYIIDGIIIQDRIVVDSGVVITYRCINMCTI